MACRMPLNDRLWLSQAESRRSCRLVAENGSHPNSPYDGSEFGDAELSAEMAVEIQTGITERLGTNSQTQAASERGQQACGRNAAQAPTRTVSLGTVGADTVR